MSSPEKKQDEDSPRSRIARYDQYHDLRTLATTLRKTAKQVKKRSAHNSILVVRRIIDSKGQYLYTVVDIKSDALCKVLREINTNVEGLELNREPPEAESQLFFHSHAALKACLDKEQARAHPDTGLVEDLATALQFVAEDYGDVIADFTRLVSSGEITFDLLWALFTPNTLVYHYHEHTDQDQLLCVRAVYLGQRKDKSVYLAVVCDVVSHDGKAFGMARDSSLEIDKYQGSRKIQDLRVYPWKYNLNANAVFDRAVRRGKKFAQMAAHSYHEIDGMAMKEVIIDKGKMKTKIARFNSYGRVMIDPTAFRMFEPNCAYNFKVHERLDPQELTDKDFAICSPVALGFCFGTKTWGGFAMDRLRDIVWNEEAFPSLVLGSRQKTLVHSLIRQHSKRATLFDDVIAGKGRGLIGLLSGGPGCGKTLTAEAVAEVTARALYAVSAGELGIEPEVVERNLIQILQLARRWDAVLLLDEAEVFMQRRDKIDLKRNALVSIFLRQLEYFQGILILTTNIIKQCDAAFESRIHFAIHYPDLDYDARKQIWEMFLGKVSTTHIPAHTISDEDVERLASREMNGRQIKNTLSTAQSIALEEKSPLSVAHVDAVFEVASDWNKAMRISLQE